MFQMIAVEAPSTVRNRCPLRRTRSSQVGQQVQVRLTHLGAGISLDAATDGRAAPSPGRS